MDELQFEWDEQKSTSNEAKHKECHCYREDDKVIRIISARKATKNEQTNYGK